MENKEKLEVALKGKTLTITLGRKLLADNAPALTEELTKYVGQDIHEVVFDASKLNIISSAGLRVVFFVSQKIGNKPNIVFLNCAPEIHTVLKHVGLAQFIEFKQLVTIRKEFKKDVLEEFAANNDIVCYQMKMGETDD
jgi:anti-anti-sigma factor